MARFALAPARASLARRRPRPRHPPMEFPVPDSLTALWQDLVAIPHIGFYLTAGWAIYLVWLSTWIVLQKREPVATLSWL